MEQINRLEEFLKKIKSNEDKDNSQTFTRIPHKQLNIWGGSWNVPNEHINTFWSLYDREINHYKTVQYLTQLQNKKEGGPIFIDLDFKFDYDIDERKLKKEFIIDLIGQYEEELAKIVKVNENTTIPVFVFMKDHVNQCQEQDCTKDGIHIIIGINLHHAGQKILRNNMIKWIKENNFFNSLGDDCVIKNGVEDILDLSITTGNTGWQLYGSRKPGHEDYKLKYKFEYTYIKDEDEEDEYYESEQTECEIDEEDQKAKNYSTHKIWCKLEIRDEMKDLFEKMKKNTNNSNGKKIKNNKPLTNFVIANDNSSSENIDEHNSLEELQADLKNRLAEISREYYFVKEAHMYVMALSSKYYDQEPLWKQIGWALHRMARTSDETLSREMIEKILLMVYIDFSSKSKKFDFHETVPQIMNYWNNHFNQNGNDKYITLGTIKHYLNRENPTLYKKLKENSTDYFVEKTLKGTGTDFDLAMLTHQMYNQDYVCVNIDKNFWYEFKSPRWVKCQKAHSLRKKLSTKVSKIYVKKEQDTLDKIRNLNGTEDQTQLQQKLTSLASTYSDITLKLKNNTPKTRIINESAPLFFDEEGTFIDNMDDDPYLLCFKNGVYDFRQKCFRKGMPEDCLTLCTGIDYIELDDKNPEHIAGMEFFNNFMEMIFPDEPIRQYMWEHSASALIGNCQNEDFNIYIGRGCNGKSKYVDLMTYCLGDYKKQVPLSLIIASRPTIGGVSPEVARLKGARYAVIQEPQEDTDMNAGVMKELTGGDPITARSLFLDTIEFKPQFNLVCASNYLFNVKSNDDGTWRRIKKIDFKARFVDENPSEIAADHEYLKDKNFTEKLKPMAPYFMAMLVKIAKRTMGKVSKCAMIEEQNDNYRKRSDHVGQFITEKIVKGGKTSKITQANVKAEFKYWWEQEHGKEKMPKLQKLIDRLTDKLGRYKKHNAAGKLKHGWYGWTIKVNPTESEDEDEEA